MIYLKANPTNIKKAAAILADGGIGAFPTETVYGLGADALSLNSVAKVFEAKKRPTFDPLIVHVADLDQMHEVCEKIPPAVIKLVKKFSPGPLTYVLPKKKCVPDLVTAGLSTVAVRIPNHKTALDLLRAFKKPIAAPSANRFGRTSCTTAESVQEELEDKIDFVLDGGVCEVGVESTIIKLESSRCLILRPGGVTVEELKKELPNIKIIQPSKPAIDAPGQLDSHYATETPLIYSTKSIASLLPELKTLKEQYAKKKRHFPRIAVMTLSRPPENDIFFYYRYLSMKGDMAEAASNLFETMRLLDTKKADLILVEHVPSKGLGFAIHDRLTRASVASDIVAILKKKL